MAKAEFEKSVSTATAIAMHWRRLAATKEFRRKRECAILLQSQRRMRMAKAELEKSVNIVTSIASHCVLGGIGVAGGRGAALPGFR